MIMAEIGLKIKQQAPPAPCNKHGLGDCGLWPGGPATATCELRLRIAIAIKVFLYVSRMSVFALVSVSVSVPVQVQVPGDGDAAAMNAASTTTSMIASCIYITEHKAQAGGQHEQHDFV